MLRKELQMQTRLLSTCDESEFASIFSGQHFCGQQTYHSGSYGGDPPRIDDGDRLRAIRSAQNDYGTTASARRRGGSYSKPFDTRNAYLFQDHGECHEPHPLTCLDGRARGGYDVATCEGVDHALGDAN